MRRARRALLALATALTTALAMGCGTPPVRYYSLAGPLPDTNPALSAQAGSAPGRAAGANGSPVHIDVAPVGVPERLARPQMLIRNATRNDTEPVGPQVDLLEQQRWVSPLDSELRDAFAGAIASRAGAIDVTRGGRLPGQPVYRVAIRVGHLDAVLDRQVDAVFGWTITRSDDSRHAICEVSVTQPAGRGMDALVQAVKRSVAVAAEHMARQIMQLQESATAPCDDVAGATNARWNRGVGSADAAAGADARDGGGAATPAEGATVPDPSSRVTPSLAAPARASSARTSPARTSPARAAPARAGAARASSPRSRATAGTGAGKQPAAATRKERTSR